MEKCRGNELPHRRSDRATRPSPTAGAVSPLDVIQPPDGCSKIDPIGKINQILTPLPIVQRNIGSRREDGGKPMVLIFQQLPALEISDSHAGIEEQVQQWLDPLRITPIMILAGDIA